MKTKPYVATFNHGSREERFYALDDEHASRVAHEIAARWKLCFDAVQLDTTKLPDPFCPDGRCVRD
jgi:hypothetical protein